MTDEEIKSLVKEWHSHRAEGELNQDTVKREIRSMEKSVANYNVEQLGSIPIEREDGGRGDENTSVSDGRNGKSRSNKSDQDSGNPTVDKKI